ncbi:cgmp-dependent protein kinase [Lasius niger]|uniref:Cgmp-dependent protein kinase n=1 Tax=Lasius niger TaxID=67767 RepID=A0A0J7KU45_LASNI|nr:cgmp-dependent protein kinase [Lasius niger]
MKVRSYPGRAVLEDPELLLDPDATRGRAMELLYEASWRECGVNWTSSGADSGKISPRQQQEDERFLGRPYVDVVSQLEGKLEVRASTRDEDDARSRGSSSTDTLDSECSEMNQPPSLSSSGNAQGGFLIPRPRLIVPVHTYARRRRTGAPQPVKRRQIREGICGCV